MSIPQIFDSCQLASVAREGERIIEAGEGRPSERRSRCLRCAGVSVCDQATAIVAADAAAHVAPAQGAESEDKGHANETLGVVATFVTECS